MNVDITKLIRDSAMLATYHTTAWSARAQDSAASMVAANAAGADVGAYITQKNLMFGADDRLKAVRSAQERGRAKHTELTLQWSSSDGERGARLLPVASFHKYMSEMSDASRRFKAALKEFVDHYDDDVKVAMGRLNLSSAPAGLYPHSADVGGMFSMRPNFMPIPSGAQFRGLPDATLGKLSEHLEEEIRKSTRAATRAAVERAKDNLVSFVDRVRSSTRVMSSTYEMLSDTPAMLRNFNVVHDPNIEALANDLEKVASEHTLEDYKSFDYIREEMVNKAEALVEKFDAYLAD